MIIPISSAVKSSAEPTCRKKTAVCYHKLGRSGPTQFKTSFSDNYNNTAIQGPNLMTQSNLTNQMHHVINDFVWERSIRMTRTKVERVGHKKL